MIVGDKTEYRLLLLRPNLETYVTTLFYVNIRLGFRESVCARVGGDTNGQLDPAASQEKPKHQSDGDTQENPLRGA